MKHNSHDALTDNIHVCSNGEAGGEFFANGSAQFFFTNGSAQAIIQFSVSWLGVSGRLGKCEKLQVMLEIIIIFKKLNKWTFSP